jgi:hypothetical protein
MAGVKIARKHKAFCASDAAGNSGRGFLMAFSRIGRRVPLPTLA